MISIEKTNYTIDEVNEALALPCEDPDKCSSHRVSEWANEWTTTRNYADSVDLSLNGDVENLDRAIAAMPAGMILGSGSGGIDTVRDVAGDYVDVGVYCSGDPNCMISQVASDQGKIVSVIVDICASAAIPSAAMAARGSAAMAVISRLESCGYSVGVDVTIKSDNWDIRITLKKPSDYLSPAILAYWAINPSALRRSWFRLAEMLPLKDRQSIGAYRDAGYGYVHNTEHTADLVFSNSCDLGSDVAAYVDRALKELEVNGFSIN